MTSRASGLSASLASNDARLRTEAPMPDAQRLKSARRFSAHSSFISSSTFWHSTKLWRHAAVASKMTGCACMAAGSAGEERLEVRGVKGFGLGLGLGLERWNSALRCEELR